MPRFAAAFISFLALQGFAQRASNMMARNLAVATDCNFLVFKEGGIAHSFKEEDLTDMIALLYLLFLIML